MPRRETKVARWLGTSDVVTEAVTEPLCRLWPAYQLYRTTPLPA
jgi:hypothetical protein